MINVMIKLTKNAVHTHTHMHILCVYIYKYIYIYISNHHKTLKNHYILLIRFAFRKSIMKVVNFERVPVLSILVSAQSLAKTLFNKHAF